MAEALARHVSNSRPPVAEYTIAQSRIFEPQEEGARPRQVRREKSKKFRQVARQVDSQCAAHAFNNLLQQQKVVFDWRRRDEERPSYYNMAHAVIEQNERLTEIGMAGHDVGDRRGNMLVSVVDQTMDKLKLRNLKFTITPPGADDDGDTVLDELAIRVLEEQDGFVGFFVPHTNPRLQALHYNVFRHDPRALRTKKERTEGHAVRVISEVDADRYVFIDSLDKQEIGRMVNLGVYTRAQMLAYFKQRCYTNAADDSTDEDEAEGRPVNKRSRRRADMRNGVVIAVLTD